MNKPLILYHGPSCGDGFCAAWIAWLKFGDQAEYVPIQYGQEPPDVTGREVYILSGVRLTWEYFFPEQPASWLVDYTEDRDLWLWKLPESKEINIALASMPRIFEEWYKLYMDSTARVYLAEAGVHILRYQVQQVDDICANAREVRIDEYLILAANTCLHQSDVGERLAQGKPFGATWMVTKDGKKVWSLRSREGGIDVSELARRHGGGGHAQAARFTE